MLKILFLNWFNILLKVQLGEELLATGDFEGGIEHLANAVAVCGQPRELLGVLQKTLAPQVFHLLVQRLPSVGHVIIPKKILNNFSKLTMKRRRKTKTNYTL